MKKAERNLLVLFKHGQTVEQEFECLHEILQLINSPEYFCRVNELVDRFHITRRPKKMLKEASYLRLRAFRFFANMN